MKFNLKNRPTEVFELTRESMFQKLREWIQWAEGLEIELRQKLEKYEKEVEFCQKNLGLFSATPFLAQIKLIKEILGEKNEG